ncbi:TRL-like family protein [Leptospira langatensis]|uniref:TRL-like family protein n=1 Tax=Leptospira langatensis TaxID=2484983 RepID=A0A5F1ZWF4_9LEPT|nr:TRL-like family protein [Leptospira langatensis]TGJ98212.1 TRL-like family protein [Leptospira langatensis]TGL43126.1 TRL-like family protein [Leptospira langatensis]
MKIKSLIFSCFLLLGLANCTGANMGNVIGATPNTNPTKNYGLPLGLSPLVTKGAYLIHSGDIPGQIGFNAEAVSTGTACSRSILNLIAFGDSSLAAAKADGRINKIAAVNYEQFAILEGVYHSFCTVVSGSAGGNATTNAVPTTPILNADPNLTPKKR